jgi:NAD(P)-dependent dehydrogenase (short-subunit alcohol dehydrogenase family)
MRSGSYERWIERNIPDLTGKVIIITGANSGLGFEAAKVLAVKGARVVMAVRDLARGEQAAGDIRRTAPRAGLEVMALDLAGLASVRRFAETFSASHDRLDVLLNNAGVMAIPRRVTVDGFEMQLGTNHLGHFALTGLLLPRILRTPGSRIVTVSSGAHVFGKINFDDLQSERSYSKWGAYGQSKLANLLFAYEFQRKLAAAGSSVISVAAHPGYASTNLQAVGPQMEGSRLGARTMAAANRVLAQSAAMGALPEVYAATSPDVRGGDYIGPDGLMGQRGFPRKVRSNSRSYDQAVAARLWAVSEELTGVRYVLG